MRLCKDFDTELGVWAGLLVAEFVIGEGVPAWGNTKTVGTVVVSSCSTTRGLLWNRGILLGLASSWYRVSRVVSIGAGGLFAESEIRFDAPGVDEVVGD